MSLPSQPLLAVIPILPRRLFRLALVAVRATVFATLVILVPVVALLCVRFGLSLWRSG